MFKTDVVVVNSGYESRNRIWQYARIMADVSQNVKTLDDFETLQAFFNLAAGKANAFRVKDWTDYVVPLSRGVLGTGVGSGDPAYQLGKRYTTAAQNYDRPITRPVSGQVAVTRNGTPVVIGLSGGQLLSINVDTGIVTFRADATQPVTSFAVGATTSVTLAGNPGSLVAGQRLYLTGFTGASAGLLNNRSHLINSVVGAAFVLATNTAGADIGNFLGTAFGLKYPQSNEPLAWAGQFDVPMRFDIDQLVGQIIAPNVYSWSSIPLVEVRDENN
jgi:uncharacterized protein (TIGR02217 family)